MQQLEGHVDGLDHFVIAGLGRDVSYEFLAESSQRFGRAVIPRVKATVLAGTRPRSLTQSIPTLSWTQPRSPYGA